MCKNLKVKKTVFCIFFGATQVDKKIATEFDIKIGYKCFQQKRYKNLLDILEKLKL